MFKCEACNKVSRHPVRLVSGVRQVTYEHKNAQGKVVRVTKGTEITGEMNLCSSCADIPVKEYTNKPQDTHDCNNCDKTCEGDFTAHGKRKDPIRVIIFGCLKGHKTPSPMKTKMINLALDHPDSLNQSLVALKKESPGIDISINKW